MNILAFEAPRVARFLIAALMFCFAACSSFEASKEHSDSASNTQRDSLSKQTVVLFLVDGLSQSTLKNALANGRVNAIRDYFLLEKNSFSRFSLGRAVFPTETYPNLASILSVSTFEDHLISGNQLIRNGKKFDFESVTGHNLFEKWVEPLTVFHSLESRSERSASFSYVLGQNAETHSEVGLQIAFEYSRKEYVELDDRLIDSLDRFLADRRPENWPAFIYVHLVGVDGYSHEFGPDSAIVSQYLQRLSLKLSSVLSRLKMAEYVQGKRVVALMTADHGFVTTQKVVELESMIRRFDSRIEVLNGSRVISLISPSSPKKPSRTQTRRHMMAALNWAVQQPGVQMVAYRSGEQVVIASAERVQTLSYGRALCENDRYSLQVTSRGFRVARDRAPHSTLPTYLKQFRCPNEFDQSQSEFDAPFLYSSIATYFRSATAADALILAKDHFSFNQKSMGAHGGLTREEMLVPILLRNAEIDGAQAPPKTSDLLNFLVGSKAGH